MNPVSRRQNTCSKTVTTNPENSNPCAHFKAYILEVSMQIWLRDSQDPFWDSSNIHGEFRTLNSSLPALASVGKRSYHQQHLSIAVKSLAPGTSHNINHKSPSLQSSHTGATPLQVSQRHFLTATVCKPLTHLSSRIDSGLRSVMISDENFRKICVGKTSSVYQEKQSQSATLYCVKQWAPGGIQSAV